MKILLGVPEYPPFHIGGGGEVYKNLAENYKKLGNEVVVFYGFYPTNSWFEKIKIYTENGIKFYQIPEIPYPKNYPYLRTVMPANPKSSLTLKRLIEREKPDIAHLHGYGLPLINNFANKLNKLNIKYIFTIHGYPETQNQKNFLIKYLWNLYIKFIMNPTLKNAKSIGCISKYIKNDKRNIYNDKSRVIFNGINTEEYKHVLNNINIKEKYNCNKSDLLIFSLGRISKMKGFQNIIKLIPKLNKSGIKVKYLIAGKDDGYKNKLIKLIDKLKLNKQVKFVGFLDLEQKKQYIKQCNLFAIPSLWEPFGLVALEGMVMDKTILSSEIGGLKEVLKNYNKKININSSNLIENIMIKQKINGNFNPNIFDWVNISKKYIKLLEEV